MHQKLSFNISAPAVQRGGEENDTKGLYNTQDNSPAKKTFSGDAAQTSRLNMFQCVHLSLRVSFWEGKGTVYAWSSGIHAQPQADFLKYWGH